MAKSVSEVIEIVLSCDGLRVHILNYGARIKNIYVERESDAVGINCGGSDDPSNKT